jgi:hypothetical protein
VRGHIVPPTPHKDSTGFSCQMACLYCTVSSVFGSHKKEIRLQYRNGTAMRIFHSTSDITTEFNTRIRQASFLNTLCVREHSSEMNTTSCTQKKKQGHCVFRFGVEPMPTGLKFIGLKDS